MNATTRSHVPRMTLLALAGIALACSPPPPGTFKEPADAMKAVHDFIGTGDEAKADDIFGAGSKDMLESGDPVADKEDGAKVKALIAEKVAFEEPDPETRIALIGNEAWPFPIPLVKDGDRWRFDSAAGKEEIANRRVGENELDTIATLHGLVDAQRDYAAEGWDGLPPQYARRLISSDGMHDGLYWPAVEGEPESPIGEAVAAAAAAEGYPIEGGDPEPFHGYNIRLLDAQGPSAPGGARSYVDADGNMTGGFACVAWPAKHGMSGIMTFLVNHNGIVYHKDLGEGTQAAAEAMTTFDPDSTWEPTWDSGDAPVAAASGGQG